MSSKSRMTREVNLFRGGQKIGYIYSVASNTKTRFVSTEEYQSFVLEDLRKISIEVNNFYVEAK